MLVGEVEVGERVRLGILQELACRRTDGSYFVYGKVMECTHQCGVALEVDDAALPGGPPETSLPWHVSDSHGHLRPHRARQ